MSPLTLTCGEVAVALGYLRTGQHAGEPNRTLVHRLARDGSIPQPIDMELSVTRWRWSRAEIEAYVAGQWKSGVAS